MRRRGQKRMPGRDKAGTLRVRMAATATVLILLACPSSRAAETSCTGVGEIVSIEHFGASADYKVLFTKFGITAEAVTAAAERVVAG